MLAYDDVHAEHFADFPDPALQVVIFGMVNRLSARQDRQYACYKDVKCYRPRLHTVPVNLYENSHNPGQGQPHEVDASWRRHHFMALPFRIRRRSISRYGPALKGCAEASISRTQRCASPE